MTPEDLARQIASAIEGDYPEMLISAHVDSDPSVVWVEAVDYARGDICQEFRLTVEEQP
jgi:hypothetical protein